MKITKHSPNLTIVEQDACRRSIQIAFFYEKNNKRYFLSMPPIIFFIKHTKGFRITSVYGFFVINKKLYQLPFYNIFDNGKICLGRFKKKFDSLENLINGFLQSFWTSVFTEEAGDSFKEYLDKKKFISDYEKWQDKTKKNKNWIPNSRQLVSISKYGKEDIKKLKTDYVK